MANVFELHAKLREDLGTSAVRRLRRLDVVPGTVYGAGKEPCAIMFAQKDLSKALNHEAIFSHILTLKIGDQEEKVVLKALQRHETKPRILHIDFQRIKATEKLYMTVPIHFIGEQNAPGLKSGAIFSKLMADIEIKCLPADLPEAIEVDVSQMELDDALHLSDLKLPNGVELTIPELDEARNATLVSLHKPRVSKEDLEAEAAEAAAAQAAGEQPGAVAEESKEPTADAESSDKQPKE